jgi:hypothetical protein
VYPLQVGCEMSTTSREIVRLFLAMPDREI